VTVPSAAPPAGGAAGQQTDNKTPGDQTGEEPGTEPQQGADTTSGQDSPKPPTPPQTPTEPNISDPGQPAVDPPAVETISISITGLDGLIASGEVEAAGCKTVLDVLRAFCAGREIDIKVRGDGTFAYVVAIDGKSEFDEGPLSGWQYDFNGERVNKGVGAQKVAAGDVVAFIYTTTLP